MRWYLVILSAVLCVSGALADAGLVASSAEWSGNFSRAAVNGCAQGQDRQP
jgi:hypothetical protein